MMLHPTNIFYTVVPSYIFVYVREPLPRLGCVIANQKYGLGYHQGILVPRLHWWGLERLYLPFFETCFQHRIDRMAFFWIGINHVVCEKLFYVCQQGLMGSANTLMRDPMMWSILTYRPDLTSHQCVVMDRDHASWSCSKVWNRCKNGTYHHLYERDAVPKPNHYLMTRWCLSR